MTVAPNDHPTFPRRLQVDTSYTEEQVRAGDFPDDATATVTQIEPDGSTWTCEVPLADLRATLIDGAALPLEGYRVPGGSLPHVLRDAMDDATMRKALREGASKGGKRSAAEKRRENDELLDAVHRLRDEGMRTGEIVDQLLERFGRPYEPTAGTAYERARDALRKRIARAERAAKKDPDV